MTKSTYDKITDRNRKQYEAKRYVAAGITRLQQKFVSLDTKQQKEKK